MQLFLMWLYDLRGDSIARVAAGADTLLWLSEANPKADAANDTSGEDEEAATCPAGYGSLAR